MKNNETMQMAKQERLDLDPFWAVSGGDVLWHGDYFFVPGLGVDPDEGLVAYNVFVVRPDAPASSTMIASESMGWAGDERSARRVVLRHMGFDRIEVSTGKVNSTP